MARSITPLLSLVVLASLREGPAHAYQIKKRIDVGLGKFVRVADGSLYPLLHTLESAGLIESRVEPADRGRPDRVVYSITDAGRADLLERLAAPLAEGVGGTVDFYARVVCFGFMERETKAALIRQRRGRVYADLAALAEARERIGHEDGHIALADLRERQLKAELAWLDDLERAL